jgi:hypothetical protein
LRTEDLISSLTADVEPVRPFLSPVRRAFLWSVVALACVGLGVLHFGVRGDEMSGWYRLGFSMRLTLLVSTMWLAVVAAFRLSVPGEDLRTWSRWWPLVTLAILVVMVAADVAVAAAAGEMGDPMRAWTCVRKMSLVGAFPAVLAIVLIQRAQAMEPKWAILLGVLAAGAAGALTSEIACPIHAPIHVLLWHVLPVATCAVLGVALGVLFSMRRVSRRAVARRDLGSAAR